MKNLKAYKHSDGWRVLISDYHKLTNLQDVFKLCKQNGLEVKFHRKSKEFPHNETLYAS